MENLNAVQIKKALECCHKDSNCDGCMYGKYRRKKNGTCIELMQRDALALINSQEQRIGKLTEDNESLKDSNEHLAVFLAEAKADTVRKMQEALEQRIHSKLSYHGWYLKETVIPETTKELLNDAGE